MKLKDNIAVSESGFIFDPDTGESFSVNSTGKMILKLLAAEKSVQEILAIVQEEYEVDEKSFIRTMDDFTHSLRRFHLIESEHDEQT